MGNVITFAFIGTITLIYFIIMMLLLKFGHLIILYWQQVQKISHDKGLSCTTVRGFSWRQDNFYLTQSFCRAGVVFSSNIDENLFVILDEGIFRAFGKHCEMEKFVDEVKSVLIYKNLRLRQVFLGFTSLYLMPFFFLEFLLPKILFRYFIPIISAPVSIFNIILAKYFPLINVKRLDEGDFELVRQFAVLRESDIHIAGEGSLFQSLMGGISLFPNRTIQSIRFHHLKAILNE